jgi:hypothetical protein
MTTKTKRILSIVIGAIPGAMVLMSGIMKLTLNPDMVKGLSAGGFGPYIQVFGAMEVLFLILFFIPKTKNIGFFLLLSYLGGAMATEVGHGMKPISAVLIALFWVSMFIWNKNLFLPAGNDTKN